MRSNLGGKKRKKSPNCKSNNDADSPVKNEFRKLKSASPSSRSKKSAKSNSGKAKKIQSFKTLVEAMKPSDEELQFRKKKSTETDSQQYSESFECTKCNRNLKFDSNESNKVQIHPCLGVLMCQNCRDYYEDGEFSLDSEGEDKYCRWCGEGGTIFGCSQCISGFCTACIKKHFGPTYLRKVQRDDDWLCFFCDPKPLWEKRYTCAVAMQMSESKSNETTSPPSKLGNKEKGSSNHKKSIKSSSESTGKRKFSESLPLNLSDSDSTDFENQDNIYPTGNKPSKRIYTSSSDETDTKSPVIRIKRTKHSRKEPGELSPNENFENFENLKHVVLEKLENILKLSENQMAFGMNWSSKIIKKLKDPKHKITEEGLRDECEKIKWFLSVMSSYLVEFCNSVDSVKKSLLVSKSKNGLEDSSDSCRQLTEPTGFSSVMQFLNFATNQVKMFMKKGLTLTDVIDAEIHDDNTFIGIKKTPSARSPKKVSFKINKSNFEGNDNVTVHDTVTEEDESLNEDSMRLVVDEKPENREGDGNAADMNSSDASIESTNKSGPSEVDILHILEILENA